MTGRARQMDGIALEALQPQVPTPLPDLRLAGGARPAIQVPGMKATLSRWRRLLEAEERTELTGDLTDQFLLCSSASWFRAQVLNWILLLRLTKAIPPLAQFPHQQMGAISVHTSQAYGASQEAQW